MEQADIKEFETFILKRICSGCNHEWFPRSTNPQKCPRCQKWLDKPFNGKETAKVNGVPTYKFG